MTRVIYFGPPGTGKTTTLLKRLEEELASGVQPDQIAFLTFTRRAKREAVERVERVLKLEAKELPYFRTIHSMCFRALELKSHEVVSFDHYKEFGAAMGLTFGTSSATELAAEGINSQNKGDQLLALDNLARLRGLPLQKVWSDARSGIAWHEVDHFARSYQKMKEEQGLFDFTDVLSEFVKRQFVLPLEVAFVDEAQDLSPLQWLATLQACAQSKRQYVAGDDDQAIYHWAGAEVQFFIDLPGERHVLDHSYRLTRRVHSLAEVVIQRVKNRVPKEFKPRDAAGIIKRHASTDSIKIEPGTKWLWLVRNRYLMADLRQAMELRGLVYIHHGASSIVEGDRDVIYTWERLRAGKPQSVGAIRAIYKKLAARTQVTFGFKALKAEEEEQLTLQQLRSEFGLRVDGPWFDIFASIPIRRRIYYRHLLRTHGTLKLEPQIQLETIHGAKGAEAPNVALFLEQSARVWAEMQLDPDEEHRVWYVGITRAIEQLHIVEASGKWAYPLRIPGEKRG